MVGSSEFIPGAGRRIASKNVLSGAGRVRWMVREPSRVAADNGWRIFSHIDTSDYLHDPDNMEAVDFNRVNGGTDPDPFTEVTGSPEASRLLRRNLEAIAEEHRDSPMGRLVPDVLAGRRPLRDLQTDPEFMELTRSGVAAVSRLPRVADPGGAPAPRAPGARARRLTATAGVTCDNPWGRGRW